MRYRKSLIFLLISFLILFYLPVSGSAQKIVAEVTVILEKLPLEKREKMADFEQKLTNYINEYEWCEDQYQTVLPIRIQIYLQDASVSFEDRYSGNLLIANSTDVQFFDKRWRFNYDSYESLIPDENLFHPLTSVLEFYMYIVLAIEFDKYGKFGGTPYYNKSVNINEQARFSKFIQGWDERKILIEKILSKNNEPYREALDSYFLGISYSNDDFDATRKYCKKAILLLAGLIQKDSSYELPKQFIDGRRTEIINIFKDAEDYRDIFVTLVKIDPDHAKDYKDYL